MDPLQASSDDELRQLLVADCSKQNKTELYYRCRAAGLDVRPTWTHDELTAAYIGAGKTPDEEHPIDALREGLIGFIDEYWQQLQAQLKCYAKNLHHLDPEREDPYPCGKCLDTMVIACVSGLPGQHKERLHQLRIKATKEKPSVTTNKANSEPLELEQLRALPLWELFQRARNLGLTNAEEARSAFGLMDLDQKAQAIFEAQALDNGKKHMKGSTMNQNPNQQQLPIPSNQQVQLPPNGIPQGLPQNPAPMGGMMGGMNATQGQSPTPSPMTGGFPGFGGSPAPLMPPPPQPQQAYQPPPAQQQAFLPPPQQQTYQPPQGGLPPSGMNLPPAGGMMPMPGAQPAAQQPTQTAPSGEDIRTLTHQVLKLTQLVETLSTAQKDTLECIREANARAQGISNIAQFNTWLTLVHILSGLDPTTQATYTAFFKTGVANGDDNRTVQEYIQGKR
jgi:hypothetical protein